MSKWNDTFWLGMAEKYASEGSKDPSTKVGCVIVRPDKTACSWGTNGFPQGIADTPERLDDRTTKLELTIHAELNAMLFAPERIVGYTIYTTFAPCIRCAVNIIQAKLARVVFRTSDNLRWKVEQANAIALFDEAGLDVVGYDADDKIVLYRNDCVRNEREPFWKPTYPLPWGDWTGLPSRIEQMTTDAARNRACEHR